MFVGFASWIINNYNILEEFLVISNNNFVNMGATLVYYYNWAAPLVVNPNFFVIKIQVPEYVYFILVLPH